MKIGSNGIVVGHVVWNFDKEGNWKSHVNSVLVTKLDSDDAFTWRVYE